MPKMAEVDINMAEVESVAFRVAVIFSEQASIDGSS